MPDIDSFFSSKYLRADDLNGQDVTLTIKAVTGVTYTDGTEQPLIHWQEPGVKPFGCNTTNKNTIIALLGVRDTDELPGKQVTLYPSTVDTAGQFLGRPCIRIRQGVPRTEPAESPPADTPQAEPVNRVGDYRDRIALVKASGVPSLFEDVMREIVGDKSLDGADMKALADDVQKAREAMGS